MQRGLAMPEFVRAHFRKLLISLLLGLILVTRSTITSADPYSRARAFTRMVEFDYVAWAFDALFMKNMQEAVEAPRYLTIENQRELVFEYIRLMRWINEVDAQIDAIYADPEITNPILAASELNEELQVLRGMEDSLQPIAESVLQHQVSVVVAEEGLGLAGQPVPPVLYHMTRLPNALIISPRSVIRQDANISIEPDMTIDEITEMETQVEQNMGVSALVVPVGGVGIYPTMVLRTTNLEWLIETIAHEWTHNYLTLRPLGMNYMTSEQLRTMNETTANLAGKELGRKVLERFYPELAPPPTPEPAPADSTGQIVPLPTPTPEDPTVFNFRREMNKTRVRVDNLLAEGKIEEAEAYMEEQRRFFWENGYQIRRLNQAYFAFYGAYNDVPGGGAAGEDPVGPAVQALRRQSRSLAEFLSRIAWVTSFEQLRELTRE